MTLTQLLYAVTIADTKSMNKAAEKLFVSQPALSGAIKDLEDEIHTEIFIRNNKGILVTTEGEEFLRYARQMAELNTLINERFVEQKAEKKKFSVSMQHYSFAVEAFIKLANQFTLSEFELAVHETKTYEVIDNVKNYRSEIGILYVNDFNKKVMTKIFAENELEFVPLFQCGISVYMSKEHPLAKRQLIAFEELRDYPCLSFEQGDKNSFYFAEEVLSTLEYKQIIKANDRATMLNLMVGMNGYTLCSGIICEDLNGGKYVSVPLDTEDMMTIGYVKRKGMPISIWGEEYISILKEYGRYQSIRR
ncbi:MAG: LysR family transcriptional regulator [Clostridiales bacterium]|nr:LysR family transcriptional regulator [Clostridiales bacterium]